MPNAARSGRLVDRAAAMAAVVVRDVARWLAKPTFYRSYRAEPTRAHHHGELPINLFPRCAQPSDHSMRVSMSLRLPRGRITLPGSRKSMGTRVEGRSKRRALNVRFSLAKAALSNHRGA